ncbi:hypothetical protein QQF64_034246 [Cirrhinus molitorella]|uniref:Threonine synthase N-terminal domain-containing protein n=1 Tax=Cirrhinus molitorella TaxID=172907 RepID=A0ABR3MW63_9TELE
MRYCSTRAGVQGRSFRDVLFSGYAPDGGMFMPETIPSLSPETLRTWSHLSYQQLLCEICCRSTSLSRRIPRQDLEEALSSFSIPEAVRLVQLKDSLSILELFHGETLAFKDLAMSCTAQFLQYFLRKDGKRATILVGTSGDTGSSAIRSVFGLSEVDIVVVFPCGRITKVQERHTADGTSDDIDVPLRKLFADPDLVQHHGLMSLNSVNWSRILVQLAHFLFAYLQLSMPQTGGDALPVLEVLVPTGGAGNIAAGCIVKMDGHPFCVSWLCQLNDIVHVRSLKRRLSMSDSVKQILLLASDIHDPDNLEACFWLLSVRRMEAMV